MTPANINDLHQQNDTKVNEQDRFFFFISVDKCFLFFIYLNKYEFYNFIKVNIRVLQTLTINYVFYFSLLQQFCNLIYDTKLNPVENFVILC